VIGRFMALYIASRGVSYEVSMVETI
jgi:hypothetical protein